MGGTRDELRDVVAAFGGCVAWRVDGSLLAIFSAATCAARSLTGEQTPRFFLTKVPQACCKRASTCIAKQLCPWFISGCDEVDATSTVLDKPHLVLTASLKSGRLLQFSRSDPMAAGSSLGMLAQNVRAAAGIEVGVVAEV